MSRIFDAEIEKMRHLMGYGLNEGASNASKPIVEYHAEAADGKTYGILRENSKFYIKVAPKKDSPVLAEDYDYIGGFMNKKENEYTTYAVASKQFDLKMKQIAESCGSKKVIEQFSQVTPSEWQINETKEMRAEIDRMNEISMRSQLIEEGKGNFTEKHTLPEAPAKNPSKEKVNTPFVDNGVAKLDKDLNDKKTDYSKVAPFNSDGKPEGNGGNIYVDPAKMKDSVANSNGKGDGKGKGKDGKGLKEGRTVRLTEEQVLAWSDNKDYMDKSSGTRVGKSNPFNDEVGCESNQCEADTDPIREGVAMHNSDNQNVPTPGTSERGDDDPYDEPVNEGVCEVDDVDADDVAGMPEDDDEIEVDVDDDLYNDDEGFEDEEDVDDVPFPDVYTKDAEKSGMRGLENWEETWNQFDDDDDFNPYEGKSHRGERIYEVVLNDFGKHPAFRKEPMTTPTHKIADRYGKDWNDDSAKNDEPFAKEIGSGDPFTEKITNIITDAVVNMISKKKI